MAFAGLLIIEAVAAAVVAKMGAEGISRLVKGAAGAGTDHLVVRYSGYGKGKRGQDDSAFRQFLSQEIEQARGNLRNVVDVLNKKKDKSGAAAARECIDELDLYFNDVRTVPTKRLAFVMDKDVKVDQTMIEKIRGLDVQMVEKLSIVSETARRMAEMLVQGKPLDAGKEFGTMKLYLNQLRGLFKDRLVGIESLT
jgi:hypothetical protein